MSKRKLKNCKKLIAFVLCMITAIIAPLSSLPVFASNISILDVATIPQSGDKADKEYEFVAKFVDGVTQIATFGDGWRELPYSNAADSHTAMSIIPEENQREKIGVVYSNVGVYDGKEIDLKITILDWQNWTGKNYNISYRTDDISLYTQGYIYVDQIWEYVEHGTDNLVEVSGFMSVCDIDNCQYIQFSQETSESLTDIYVADTDNWICFENIGGEYKFYAPTNDPSEDEDLFSMFTFTYRDRSSLRFKWGSDLDKRGFAKDRTWDTSLSYGDHFLYMAKKPLASETAAPTKLVSDLNEVLVEENRIDSRNETFTYTIYHTVPDEWEEFYYSSYVLEDTVEACLAVQDIKVYDLAGVDVTNKFDIDVSDNRVIISTKKLKEADFYFQTYQFDMDVKIKEGADLTSYIDKSGDDFIFRNKASVTIDKDRTESNEVFTKFAVKNLDSRIEKYIINTDGNYVLSQKVEHEDTVTFFGEAAISNAKIYNSIAITDQLHHSLKFKSMTVYDMNGTDITEWGTVTEENNLVSFMFKEEYITELPGTNITFMIETEISAEVDFSDIENGIVKNTYRLILDGESRESNEVEILVPTQDSRIEKAALDVDGSKVKSVGMEDNKQDIVFIGGIQITNTETIKSVELEDILHPAFTYKEMSVFDTQGNDITDKGEKMINGQTVRFVFSEEYAKTLVGKEITWKIVVNYIEGSDLSALKDSAIPNTMTLYVNGKPTDSNEVDVTPIPLVNEIVKAIIGSDGKSYNEMKLTDNGQDIKFKGSMQIGNTVAVNNVVLEDTLQNALKYKKDSIAVYDASGNNITDKGAFKQDGQTIRFTFDKDYAKTLIGKVISWEITVNYREGSDLSGLKDHKIPNTMSLYVNGDEIGSNQVTVEPIPIQDTHVKYVLDENGKEVKKIELAGNKQDITFVGRVSINNTSVINNVVLMDKLHTAFAYKRLVVYDADGNNITNKGEIKIDGNNIQFAFNKDYVGSLVGKEIVWKITVNYIEGSDLSGLENNAIPNTMSLFVNGDETTTPPVTVTPVPIENTAVKYVLDKDSKEVSAIELEDNEQEITFIGRMSINNTSVIESVVLRDQLHHSLKCNSMTVYSAEGIDITQFGTMVYDTNTVTFTFNDTYVHNLIGKDIVWKITASYIEGSDLSDLENNTITNVMNLYVNGDEITTPPVTVKPIPLTDEITKAIVGENDTEVSSIIMRDNSEEILFRGRIQINNTKEIASVELVDILHKALIYKDLTVYEAEGKNITDKGEIVIDGQTVRFVFHDDYVKYLAGKEITWEITVNYKEGSDLSGLSNLAIPNTMNLVVNGNQTDSNKVTVTPIPLANSIVKSIVDADGNLVSSIKLKDNTEVVTFRGAAAVANDAAIDTLVLKDTVSDAFIVDQESVKVLDENGEDITVLGEVVLDEANVLTYTVNNNAQSFSGQTLSWEFNVAYDQALDFTEDQTATNEMDLEINGETVTSNKVEVESDLEETAPKSEKIADLKTGDSTNIYLYFVAALIACILILHIVKRKKINKQSRKLLKRDSALPNKNI